MNPYAIAAIGVGGLLLLGKGPASAGSGLQYVSEFFRARAQVGGVALVPPSSASAVETFKAMRDAQGGVWGLSGGLPNAPTCDELRDICQAWLDAYQGGCKGGTNALTQSFFGDATYNLSMLVPRLGGSAVPGTCDFGACDDATLSKALSPLGSAVCALRAYLTTLQGPAGSGPSAPYLSEVYARVEKVATELDAADFTVAGNRSSDDLASLADIPGAIGGAILNQPVVWVVGLGLVAFLVLR